MKMAFSLNFMFVLFLKICSKTSNDFPGKLGKRGELFEKCNRFVDACQHSFCSVNKEDVLVELSLHIWTF